MSRKSINGRRVSTIYKIKIIIINKGEDEIPAVNSIGFNYYMEYIYPLIKEIKFPDIIEDIREDLQNKIRKIASRYIISNKGPNFPF